MTIFVTKYAKTRGIVPAELLEVSQETNFRAAVRFLGGDCAIVDKNEWFFTRKAAKKHLFDISRLA